jgi:hypothetical protein
VLNYRGPFVVFIYEPPLGGITISIVRVVFVGHGFEKHCTRRRFAKIQRAISQNCYSCVLIVFSFFPEGDLLDRRVLPFAFSFTSFHSGGHCFGVELLEASQRVVLSLSKIVVV